MTPEELAALSYSSPFYELLQGALKQAGYKGDIREFLMDETWQTVMPVAKWKQYYSTSQENTSGTVRQYFGTNTVPVMASYTSENAEGHLIANEGFTVVQSDMPTATLAMRYDNDSFKKGQELLKAQGILTDVNESIFNSFVVNTSNLIMGFDSLRSFTGLQVESTGKYISTSDNNPGGIEGLAFDFTKNVPKFEENKHLAGHFGIEDTNYTRKGTNHDWTQSTSNPIGDLMDMVHAYKYIKHGQIANAVFRMSSAQANIFYNNPSVKRKVALKLNGYLVDPANLDAIDVSEADVNAYLVKMQLPPIEVEDLISAVDYVNPVTKKLEKKYLQGFADGVVLLRPRGMVGHYDWQKVGNIAATVVNPLFYTNGGLVGVQQITRTSAGEIWFNGKSKGIPVPDNINMFLYCDVATSQEETT